MPYADPEKAKAYSKNYKATHKEKVKQYSKTFYEKHKGASKVYWKTHATKRKHDVMVHYSGTDPPRCADPFHLHLPNDPFLTNIHCLTIDHPNNDGAEERKRIFGKRTTAGQPFYRWLVQNGYPKGYQVLCFNCQWIQRLTG